jgi:hypothetical protein
MAWTKISGENENRSGINGVEIMKKHQSVKTAAWHQRRHRKYRRNVKTAKIKQNNKIIIVTKAAWQSENGQHLPRANATTRIAGAAMAASGGGAYRHGMAWRRARKAKISETAASAQRNVEIISWHQYGGSVAMAQRSASAAKAIAAKHQRNGNMAK